MTTTLKIARVLSGKRQAQVSAETGIPISTLSMLENGWMIAKPSQMKKLEKVLPRLKDAQALLSKI